MNSFLGENNISSNLQLTGSINVVSPAGTLSLEVTAADTVLDLREFILEYPEVCHLTCFHLFFQGRRLTIFSELSHYPGLFHANAQVTLKPGRYDEGEVRLHLEKFRQLLVSPPSKLCDMNLFETRRSQRCKSSVPTRSLTDYQNEFEDFRPQNIYEPNLCFEFNKHDFSLHYLCETLTNQTTPYPKCLKRIRPSDYNPPPGNRKLRGDILFIEVETLENEILFLTAAADGFFVNKSTPDKFDPEPKKNPKIIKDSSLVGLLLAASPLFRINYHRLLRLASETHPLANLCLPFPIVEWCKEVKDHDPNCARAENFLLDNFGAELRAPQRDWNEEYQSLVSISQNSVEDRIIRDRSVFRFYVDFVDAAHRGAKAIIEGAMPPLNPMDPQRSFVYVFNCIFFSLAVDARNQYADADGDMTAYKMASHDIKGIRAVQNVDAHGIHILATCLVDYCGQRVVAQALIPGILHGEQTESLVYGSIDVGQKFCFHQEFHDKLLALGNQIGWKLHKAHDQAGNEIQLIAAAESKGIIGSDKRLYLLDLIRCYPRDPNFLDPRIGVDKLLRPEIIKSFEDHKQRAKMVATQRTEEDYDDYHEEKKEELIRTPEVKLNVNCLSRVTLLESVEDENTLREIAMHLDTGIVKLAEQLCSTSMYIIDNEHLLDIFHSRGINMRYLGRICDLCAEKEFIKRMLETEMVIRAAKEVFCRVMMRLSEGGRQAYYENLHHDNCSNFSTIATIVRMFLNAIGGKHSWLKSLNNKIIKKAKKINSQLLRQHEDFLQNCSSLLTEDPFYTARSEHRRNESSDGSDHVFHPANVWQAIQDTIQKKYNYKFVGNLGKKKSISAHAKCCIIRNLCKKIGVQILCRDYDWNQNEPFGDKDIEDIFHVIKAAIPECAHATDMTSRARRLLEIHQVEGAYETLQNAMSLTQAVYGPAHTKTVEVHSILGVACYRLHNYEEAIENQTRATMLSEKVHGADHFNTARHYSLLSLFCHTGGQYDKAFHYINRSIYLHLLIGGEENIATCLEILNLATLNLDHRNIQKALELCSCVRDRFIKMLGENHFRVGQCEHFTALCYGVEGKLDFAYKHETRANEIFKKNRLNPSKFWRRKFQPPSECVSSSDSDGTINSLGESPLEWFCFYEVEFQGRLATHSLISRLNDLRSKSRTRHQPILRSSPEYKSRRSPIDFMTQKNTSSHSPEMESKSHSPRNSYSGNSKTNYNTNLNAVLPTLKLNQADISGNPKSSQKRKKRNRLKKPARSRVANLQQFRHVENIEKLKRKKISHEKNLRALISEQKQNPNNISKQEIRSELLALKELKNQIDTMEAVLLPSDLPFPEIVTV